MRYRKPKRQYLEYDPYWKCASIFCAECEFMRPLSYFHVARSKFMGVESYCKACIQRKREGIKYKRHQIRLCRAWRKKNGEEANRKRRELWAQNSAYRQRTIAMRHTKEFRKVNNAVRRKRLKTHGGRFGQAMIIFLRQYKLKRADYEWMKNDTVLMNKFNSLVDNWCNHDCLFALSPVFEKRGDKIGACTTAKKRNIRKDKFGNHYDKSGHLLCEATKGDGAPGAMCGAGEECR